jgi:hypothetical protein
MENTTKYDIVKELEEIDENSENYRLCWEAAETIRVLRRALDAQIAYTNALRDKYENRRD